MSLIPSVFFQVEKIIDVSIEKGNIKNVMVQWAPTWVSSLNLAGCETLIANYLAKKKPGKNSKVTNDITSHDQVALNSKMRNIHPLQRSAPQDLTNSDIKVETIENPSSMLSGENNCEKIELTSGNGNKEDNFIVIENTTYQTKSRDKEKNPNFEWVGEDKSIRPKEDKYFKKSSNHQILTNVGQESNDLKYFDNQILGVGTEEMIIVQPEEPKEYCEDALSSVSQNLPMLHSCLICGKTFKNQRKLIIHNNRVHSKINKVASNLAKKNNFDLILDKSSINSDFPSNGNTELSSNSQNQERLVESIKNEASGSVCIKEDPDINRTEYWVGKKEDEYSHLNLSNFQSEREEHNSTASNFSKGSNPVNEKEKYICSGCGMTFIYEKSFAKHRCFPCDLCHKVFTEQSRLDRHILLHRSKFVTEPKAKDKLPHTCPYCDKEFKRRDHLKRHIVIHTGEKSFACNFCGKSFGRKDYLTTHYKIHVNEVLPTGLD